MTNPYTPEKVAELIDLLQRGDGNGCRTSNATMTYAAEILTAVSAERDSFKHQADHFALRGNIAEADLARAREVIEKVREIEEDDDFTYYYADNPDRTEPIPGHLGEVLASLDKEGNDDE